MRFSPVRNASQDHVGASDVAANASSSIAPLPVGQGSPLLSAIRSGQVTLRPTMRQHAAAPMAQTTQLPLDATQDAFIQPEAGSASALAKQDGAIQQVNVFDWDDCLRFETSVYYQLVHNALATTAQRYPVLAEALARLRAQMAHSAPEGAQGPALQLSEEAFGRYFRATRGVFEEALIRDFVQKMLPQLQGDRAEKLVTILCIQARREYARLLAPQTQPAPSFLPFPALKLQLMPGARALLDQVQSAHSRTFLISNRSHSALEKEVRHLGVRQYFDAVSGTSRVTQTRAPSSQPPPLSAQDQRHLLQVLAQTDQAATRDMLTTMLPFAHPDTTTVGSINIKPSPVRLRHLLDAFSIPSAARVVCYGDKSTDISQAATSHAQGHAVQGVLINPDGPVSGDTTTIAGIPTHQYRTLHEIPSIIKTVPLPHAPHEPRQHSTT